MVTAVSMVLLLLPYCYFCSHVFLCGVTPVTMVIAVSLVLLFSWCYSCYHGNTPVSLVFQMEEDGHMDLLEVSSMGGRFHSATSALLTGVKVRFPS